FTGMLENRLSLRSEPINHELLRLDTALIQQLVKHIKILIQACRIGMRAKLIVILALVSQPQEVLKVHYMLALIVGQLVKRTIPAQYHAKFDIWHYRLREFLPNCIEFFLEQ